MSKDRRGARWLAAWLAAGLIVHPSTVLTATAAGGSVLLRIVEARADFEGRQLMVSGENFLRSTNDVVYVSLSGELLPVVSRTPADIVTQLPAGIVPGTYRLVVVRSGLVPLADAMDVTLGSSGPRGEAGEAGPKGDRGDPGPPGIPGQTGEPGRPGVDGATWLTGDGPPTVTLGRPGDFYLDGTTGDVYHHLGRWARVANIRGPIGSAAAGARLETLGGLLGVDSAAIGVPPRAVVSADCAGGAAITLAVGGAPAGEVVGIVAQEAISAPFRFLVAVRGGTPAAVGEAAQLTIRNGDVLSVSGQVGASGPAGTLDGSPLQVIAIEPSALRADVGVGFRTHEGQSVSDIVKGELNSFGITVNAPGSLPQLEYDVRWQETAFAYVSRLLEREGLHYRIGDDGRFIVDEGNGAFPAGPSLTYRGHFADLDTGQLGLTSFQATTASAPEGAAVTGWTLNKRAVVGWAGMAAAADPVLAIDQSVSTPETTLRLARALLDRERSRRLISTGTSNSPGVRAGRRVAIAGGGLGGTYVITGVRHAAWQDGGCFAYGNAFSAVPESVTYRPPLRTPVPRLEGVLSAVVTNTDDPDRLGRVKVKFPLLDGEDFESGWVRTSVPISPRDANPFLPTGSCAGAVDLEVLVSFVGGDPRFAALVGRVHNRSQRPADDPGVEEECTAP